MVKFESNSISETSLIQEYIPYGKGNFTNYLIEIDDDVKSRYNILLHSNGICVLMLSVNHYLLQNQSIINHVDLFDNHLYLVQGKSKKQAKKFKKSNQNLCSIRCSDQREIIIHNCIIGKLLEFNSDCISNPVKFFQSDQITSRYLAIFNLKFSKTTGENRQKYFYNTNGIKVINCAQSIYN